MIVGKRIKIFADNTEPMTKHKWLDNYEWQTSNCQPEEQYIIAGLLVSLVLFKETTINKHQFNIMKAKYKNTCKQVGISFNKIIEFLTTDPKFIDFVSNKYLKT